MQQQDSMSMALGQSPIFELSERRQKKLSPIQLAAYKAKVERNDFGAKIVKARIAEMVKQDGVSSDTLPDLVVDHWLNSEKYWELRGKGRHRGIPRRIDSSFAKKLGVTVRKWESEWASLFANYEQIPDQWLSSALETDPHHKPLDSLSGMRRLCNEIDMRAEFADSVRSAGENPDHAFFAKGNCVYIIQENSRNGIFKIGRTDNLAARVSQLQVGASSKLKAIAQILPIESKHSWTVDLERQLHRKFADLRLRGEWFALGSSEIDSIRSVYIKTNQWIDHWPAKYSSLKALDLALKMQGKEPSREESLRKAS